jgi:chemotaxis regulatin CheY-phosphate phosphatase CheZ
LRDRAEEAAARAQDARDRLAWVAEQRRRLAARKAMLAHDADGG